MAYPRHTSRKPRAGFPASILSSIVGTAKLALFEAPRIATINLKEEKQQAHIKEIHMQVYVHKHPDIMLSSACEAHPSCPGKRLAEESNGRYPISDPIPIKINAAIYVCADSDPKASKTQASAFMTCPIMAVIRGPR